MSDWIPLEIQEDIMKRLPVKSLIRFRSVSKAWKSLIESSKFMANYHASNIHRLLVSYFHLKDFEYKYVSIVDDDTFPQHKFPLNVPMSVVNLRYPDISSQGLLCFYDFHNSPYGFVEKRVVIWNPSIRKCDAIVVPNVLDHFRYGTVTSFGVCPHTYDPKLVKINYINNPWKIDTISCIPWQVEVFSFGSRVWRRPLCSNLPRKSIKLTRDQVDIGGVIYWLAYDRTKVGGEIQQFYMILCFNLSSEEFTEIFLPNSLAHNSGRRLSINKLKETLVVLEYREPDFCVWIMEHGVPTSFTKLFTINTPSASSLSLSKVLGFRNNGEPIVGIRIDSNEHDEELFVYEPCLQQINHIGISATRYTEVVSSYKETLLLIDY